MSDHITMQNLGRQGRFANQIFQHAFLHAYASKYGLQIQVPSWVGCHLFGTNDPPVSVRLAPINEKVGGNGQPLPPEGKEYVNRDWRGYAQFHTSWYIPFVESMRNRYEPVEAIRSELSSALTILRRCGRTAIGIHLRRGDYGRSIFYVTPTEWYLRWLDTHWDRFERPVLFVATEDASLVDDFKPYHPVMIEELGIELKHKALPHSWNLGPDISGDTRALDFYPDFWLLQHCDILLIPNSTFSFAAAMLNRNLRELWRSDLPSAWFVKIDPWNAYPLMQEKAEDYRHIPGVCLDETTYWKRLHDNVFEEK